MMKPGDLVKIKKINWAPHLAGNIGLLVERCSEHDYRWKVLVNEKFFLIWEDLMYPV